MIVLTLPELPTILPTFLDMMTIKYSTPSTAAAAAAAAADADAADAKLCCCSVVVPLGATTTICTVQVILQLNMVAVSGRSSHPNMLLSTHFLSPSCIPMMLVSLLVSYHLLTAAKPDDDYDEDDGSNSDTLKQMLFLLMLNKHLLLQANVEQLLKP
jgi:hypothetical protein